MLPKSRLVAAAAAAGTVCALVAAGTAMAAPTPPWSKHNPAVPNAFTNTTPALSAIDVNGLQGTFLAWKGQVNNQVKYKIKINGKWHADRRGPGRGYQHLGQARRLLYFATNKRRRGRVLRSVEVDGGGGLSRIKYSDGVVSNNGSINWTKPVILPGLPHTNTSQTSASPAVLFPVNSKKAQVLVAFRGPANHVRIEIGTESGPNGRRFTWGNSTRKSSWISPGTMADPTTTNAQPAHQRSAGIGAGPGNGSYVYVFWKGLAGRHKGPVSYATTPDLASTGLDGTVVLTWSLQGQVPDSNGIKGLAQSTGCPAVASATAHGQGPLLLAYKGPSGFNIRFQTFERPRLESPAAPGVVNRKQQQQHHGTRTGAGARHPGQRLSYRQPHFPAPLPGLSKPGSLGKQGQR